MKWARCGALHWLPDAAGWLACWLAGWLVADGRSCDTAHTVAVAAALACTAVHAHCMLLGHAVLLRPG